MGDSKVYRVDRDRNEVASRAPWCAVKRVISFPSCRNVDGLRDVFVSRRTFFAKLPPFFYRVRPHPCSYITVLRGVDIIGIAYNNYRMSCGVCFDGARGVIDRFATPPRHRNYFEGKSSRGQFQVLTNYGAGHVSYSLLDELNFLAANCRMTRAKNARGLSAIK